MDDKGCGKKGFQQVKSMTLAEALKDLLGMDLNKRESWLSKCKHEATSGYNDGWTQEFYQTYLNAAKHLEGVK